MRSSIIANSGHPTSVWQAPLSTCPIDGGRAVGRTVGGYRHAAKTIDGPLAGQYLGCMKKEKSERKGKQVVRKGGRTGSGKQSSSGPKPSVPCATLETSTDAAAVEAAAQALAKGTEAFAAQRMNRGIRQALAGKLTGLKI